MIVLTPEQMQQMDKKTIEKGYPEILLMETAGRGVAELVDDTIKKNNRQNQDIKSDIFKSEEYQVAVVCGKGNNGGDGLVAARYLDLWGYKVNIILMGNSQKLQGINKKNYKTCSLRDISIYQGKKLDRGRIKNIIQSSDIIIDAMLGTGLKGKVRGIIADYIDYINNYKSRLTSIIAVDIPSGISGSSGHILGKAVKADLTATMAYKKVGLCIYPGCEYSGNIKVIDIGIPDTIAEKVNYNHYQLNKDEVEQIMPYREKTGHKGSFGKVGVISGSRGMSGAPFLTGYSSLKIGAGLVRLAVPLSIQKTVASYAPELLTDGLTDNKVKLTKKALPQIYEFMEKVDVLAVGPGLGQSEEIKNIVYNILNKFEGKLVLDADAINVIDDLDLIKKREFPLILTPHPGEMSRLLNKNISEIENNRIQVARDFARKYKVYLVLKGAATIIAFPEGDIYINSTGNEGMATAGSGDVLTGIISGLMGQKLSAAEAAIVGVYLHGLAGDIACKNKNTYSLTATDIIESLEKYFPE